MVSLLLAIIYFSFISLGLPDALLGASWPMMQVEFSVPVSFAGGISLIISLGTVVSSLLSDRMTKWLGTGKVTAISTGLTAVALMGFSFSTSYWQLILWAVPYGLGAGGVDASLNNYVAIHYASRHMSWLHCMWGLGASIGPYIMGYALGAGMHWNGGYRLIGLIQLLLTAALFLSLPIWQKGKGPTGRTEKKAKPLTFRQIFRIRGAKEVMLAFLCYCALEQSAGLWACSFLIAKQGLDAETAASLAALFYIGITVGRFLSGFLTYKMNDTNMIRLGQGIICLGAVVMLLPLGTACSMAGLILVGLGCAPIYPCVIHSTPAHFGEENSQAIIGVQMAAAYVGTCAAPPIFGVIADNLSAVWLPVFLEVINVGMILMCEGLNRKTEN